MKKSFIAFTTMVMGFAMLANAQTPGQAPAATPAQKPASVNPAGAGSTGATSKVAIVQFQKALLSTQEGRKFQDELQTKFGPKKQEMDKRQADIQSQRDQLQRGGATMSDDAKNKLARDIDSANRKLQADAEDAQAELEQFENKGMQEMAAKMRTILDKYAAANSYTVVLDVSNEQQAVMWAAPETDISAELVKLYDQQYPSAAAPKPAAAAPKPAAQPPAARPPAATPPATKKQ